MIAAVGALELLQSPNIPVSHGFTTRAGGVSEGWYSCLNLGLSSGDAEASVAENRRRVLALFGVNEHHACAFSQVHGVRVLRGRPSWFAEEADAVVSNTPGLALIISTADCLPVLFYDPATGAVGAAHCGWRGTVQGIAAATVQKLTELYGSDPADLRVAFGPGISRPNYQVGTEVIGTFQEAGFPEVVYEPDGNGRFLLDVAAANRWALLKLGIDPVNLWESGVCTYADPERFFSHRRDRGRTGRHWAVIVAE